MHSNITLRFESLRWVQGAVTNLPLKKIIKLISKGEDPNGYMNVINYEDCFNSFLMQLSEGRILLISSLLNNTLEITDNISVQSIV